MAHKRGTLFLVVGPSGAGKDSLIDGAKAALEDAGSHVFPRRYITRPAGAGGEEHIPVSNEMFETLLKGNEMVLSWEAHGLHYGIPQAICEHLTQGRSIILNVSRTVVDQACETLAPVKVLYITVPDEVLADRLRQRGRESEAGIQKRIARARAHLITGEHVHMIHNGGLLKDALTDFLHVIDPA